MLSLVALLLAQPLGLTPSTLDVRDEGARVGYRPWGVDCKGAGVSCSVDGGLWYLTVGASSGSSTTKVSAAYMADASVFANQLASDPSACPGGQFVTDLAANGALTCAVPPGSSGKVSEAYMADAAIYAQVASTAYSADAAYYAETYTDSFWYDAGTGTRAKILNADAKVMKTNWPIWNTDASVGLGLWDELCDNTAPNCYREEMELAHTSANTHARAAIAFYVGGHTRLNYQGSIYGSASSGNGDVQGVNINTGTTGSFGITNGDPSAGVRTSIANFGSNKTLTLNQSATNKAIQLTTGAIVDFGAGSYDALTGDGVGVMSQGYLRVSGVVTGLLGTPNIGAYHYDTTLAAPVYGTGLQWRRFNDFAFSADASVTAIYAQEAYSADAAVYANQFAVDPTDCGGSAYATGIDSAGNLTCSVPPGGSPLTTKGDIFTRNASADDRLGVGTDGLCLKSLSSNPTGLEWGTCSAGGSGLTYAETAWSSLGGF